MGDKSDSKTKKVSSPYMVLENRPLNLWKVTELKEELKKRKLITGGLKEELVKRFDEAIRAEMDDDDKTNLENDLNSEAQSDDAENISDVTDHTEDKTENLEQDNKVETEKTVTKIVKKISVETTVVVSEESGGGSNQEPRNGEPKAESRFLEQEQAQPGSCKQVDEVSKVQSDSISFDTIIEKNEDLKDDVIADDINVESTRFLNEKDNAIANNVKENIDIIKKNDSGDVGSLEKLNLDRSSGDDSMEEDASESKQVDSKFSDEVGNKSEKVKVKEDDSVNVTIDDKTTDKNLLAVEDTTAPGVTSAKRKAHDQDKESENNETLKRQRRWNSENVNMPNQQSTNHSTSTTPKDTFQIPSKPAFSRSESTNSQDLSKERVVPPSSKTPTTSLRIDNFLRPFTLKAVQEFLSKTGTVVSFWMDQIKTHCYVMYASVEEAIDTRNAVCNLQWPVNGGRLLMADFVNPQEVKNRVDPQPPPQPSPSRKQPLPPPSALPAMPTLANPPPVRNRAPPPPEKVDPLIVTLDDLFKKTRSYLLLTALW
ncbi:uncharacterized protein LOC143564354 [Bidens hawaiensis]|uniref:uncharacterized protein LOC143564354 n=1 Tax=Bidens hawaiensis TaxID=980011 RepID=UPI00404A54EA